MDPVRIRDNIICKHCGVPCAKHDDKGNCEPCAKRCDKKVYMASGLQFGGYSTMTIDGKPFPGITMIKLTKEQLEKVRGTENKRTG